MKQLLEIICLGENDSLRDALSQMDQGKEGIVLIINPSRKLLGTITDGDVRRWMLSNNSLDVSCGIIMNKNPIVGFEREGKPEWGKKLNDFRIRTIPIVDEENVVID